MTELNPIAAYQPETSNGKGPQSAGANHHNLGLSTFQLVSGRGLDDRKAIGRLLYLRDLALEADLACKWKRSDFFWQECFRELRNMVRKSSAWLSAKEFLDSNELRALDSEDLKKAFVDERLVKTLLALRQAAQVATAASPTPESREFVYLTHVRDAFDIAGIDSRRQADVLIPLVDRLIETQRANKRWKSAIDTVGDMLLRFPDQLKYREKLMILEFQSVIDSLPSDKPFGSGDSKLLKRAIDKIEKLRVKYPAVPVAFTLIGRLRHYRSIALANTEDVSNALVESLKALDYLPDDEEITKTNQHLIERMKALKQKMSEVERELRREYSKRLTPEGQRNLNDANRGFTPMEEYAKSPARGKIQKDANNAVNKQIWLSMPYPEPAGDWSAQAKRLIALRTQILNARPAKAEDIEPLWRILTQNEIGLAGLDPKPVVRFVSARLFPKRRREQTLPLSTATSQENLPKYQFQSTKEIRSDEPFLFRLFGHQGKGLKAMLTLAFIILLAALIAW